MPDGSDIDWLFSEEFRRLTLVLGNTKNQKQREQIQLIIEGVAAIKTIVTDMQAKIKHLQDALQKKPDSAP